MAAAHTLRPNEVRAINLADYRQTNMHIHSAVKGRRADAPVRGAKERNWRVVGADEELQAWIEWRRQQATPEERLHGQVPLFPNPAADNPEKRWTPSSMRRAWEKAARQVGVSVSMYPGTKHTTATELIRRGEARETVQALLGHADPRSTDHYVVLADRFVTDTIRRSSVTGPSKPKSGPRK
jgi:integrase